MAQEFEVTWHGHACFTVGMSKKVLIDPFLEGNPSAKIKPEDVHPDVVVVTHAHSDHLGDAVKIATLNNVPIVTMVELGWLLQEENKDLQVHGINMSGSVKVSGVTFTSVPAFHSSGYNGKYGGSPMGVVIQDGLTVYHAGDTGVFKDMELIHEIYHPTISMIPIGGYFTMSPKEAIFASRMLQSRYVIPMHYNTFDLIKQNVGDFTGGFGELKGQTPLVVEIEKTVKFDSNGNKL